MAAWTVVGVARVVQGQAASAPPSIFVGRLTSTVDARPVAGAAVRLLPIDSTRMSLRLDVDSAMIFVDSTRVRFATSDSLGVFRITALPTGRYLLQVRRLGYAPREGVLTVGIAPDTLRIPVEPTSTLLAGMTITESSLDANGRYLRSVGFAFRQHGGLGGRYLATTDIRAHNWNRTDEILLWEGLKYNPMLEVRIDGMPVRREEALSYPASLIMAVEVYPDCAP
jgi:hypothetical protein